MIQHSRVVSIPAIMNVRHRAPTAAAAPWWLSGGVAAANAIAVYQPKGAASLAASYVNLANPGTYDAAPGTAPTWASATGWIFDGSTQYLTTGVIPASNGTWSAIGKFIFRPVGVMNRDILGLSDSVPTSRYQFELRAHYDTTSFAAGNCNTTTARTPGGNTLSGIMAFAGLTPYWNGVAQTNLSLGAVPATIDTALFVGARNSNGTPDTYFLGDVSVIVIYNTTLTAAQVLAVSTAMAAL